MPLLVLALLVAGCAAPALEGEADRAPVSTDAAGMRPIEKTFTGSVSSPPLGSGVAEFALEVPSGAVGVNGTLTWSSPGARLRLELVNPRGEIAATGWQEADGRVSLATVDPAKPGTWTFRVMGQTAVNVPFTLVGRVELIVPENNLVRDTVELGAASFYEINLIMEANASFTFRLDADAPVRWDIHSHPPSGLKKWDGGESASVDTSFTAPERGVYSVLFENPGATPVRVDYEVAGRFRMHSHGG